MSLIPILVSLLAVEVASYSCQTKGNKYIASLSATKCYVNVYTNLPTGKKLCSESLCCAQDKTICGNKVVNCGTDMFKDAAKSSTVAGTTTADQKTNCCSAKVKCSTVTCPAGKKKKTNSDNHMCTGTKGCGLDSNCCITDTTKCLGSGVICASTHYMDKLKYGNEKTTTPKTACCTAKATCASATCKKGYVVQTSTKTCPSDSASCTNGYCCIVDKTLCLSVMMTLACGTGKTTAIANGYNAKGTTAAEHKTNCCGDLPAEASCDAWSKETIGETTAKTSAASTDVLSATIAAFVVATMALV